MKTEDLEDIGVDALGSSSHPSVLTALTNSTLVRFLLLFTSGWAAVRLLAYFEVLVVVFVASTILAFLLNYPATWLSRWLPRGVAAIVVFLISLALLSGLSATLGAIFLSQGQQLVASLQSFSDSLQPWLSTLDRLFNAWNLPLDLQGLEPQIQNQAVALLTAGLTLAQATLANLVLGILIAVVTMFMLLDGARVWWWLLNVLPIHHKQRFNTVIQKNLLGFFWGRLLLAMIVGLSTFFILSILRVPYPAFLALTVGLFDLIPGIGATLGISLVSLLLLSQSVWLALKVLLVCVAMQQVEENLLLPYVMKDSIDINPVVMFFALMVGATVAGVLGLFLAVPVAGVIVTWLEIDAMRGKPGQD